MTDTSRQPGQPRLSVTIPTFNRAIYLAELLECLLPQISGSPAGTVELLISDNCSDDGTQQLIADFQSRGLLCRYVRNAQNLGADANFLQCLNLATGQYVWVLGDDDLLVPNAIPDLISLLSQGEFDMVFLSCFGFSGDLNLSSPNTQVRGDQTDRLGRYAEVVTDGVYFIGKVNALIGLISANIINKNRLMATPHPPIESLNRTNLLQVGWLFPLLHERVSVLYLWKRLVAYRSFNSGGWGICEVFGVGLSRIAGKYFATEPRLARALMNNVLQHWMLNEMMNIRRGNHGGMNQENFANAVRHVFSGNWRYWVFVHPVATLPMPAAEAVFFVLNAINRASRILHGVLRHLFRHGKYLQPQPASPSGPS